MKTQVISYSYNRENVKSGILHIGVGNFHRAHQEYYTSLLLENEDQQHWGICGAMILPSDERLYKALKEQGGKDVFDVGYHHPDQVALPVGEGLGLRIGLVARLFDDLCNFLPGLLRHALKVPV